MKVSDSVYRPTPIQPANTIQRRHQTEHEPASPEQQVAATNNQQQAQNSSSTDDSDNKINPTFLLEAIEYMIAHRVGIDKQKIDELKEEIDQLEAIIDTAKDPNNPDKMDDATLKALEQKLAALKDQLEQLIKQSAERHAEQEAKDSRNNHHATTDENIPIL